MTITLPNLPEELDRALRARAAAENKSLDAAALDALARGLGFDSVKRPARRDLTGVAGRRLITEEMRQSFADQRQIDSELWK